ncbi:MAG: hypothetical protein F9K36_02725 [Burkholderiaceae bacterium]|nr:MAG: hypothetical protein F9K36_02725 [Burkholderiaceae bacterium]
MRSYLFFFNAESFERKRRLIEAGQPASIDYVGADDKLPFNGFTGGDELFITGIRGGRMLLAGRMIVADRPLKRPEAVARTGRTDLIDKPLICLADDRSLDSFRIDLPVPVDMMAGLKLFATTGKTWDTESLEAGVPDPNVFRACPQLSAASADVLRALLGAMHGQGDTIEVPDEEPAPGAVDDEEYRRAAIKTRRGQSKFRVALLAAYGSKCQVTNCRVVELLEAAHITPHAELTDYAVSNGLLLRADIHTLFDENLLAVDDNYRICVSPLLRNSEYWRYDGQKLDRFPDKTG